MHDTSVGERFEAIVIGGGQAGLAAGYHLRRHGLGFVILDAGAHVGDAWRSRWDGLRLFTPVRYDSLPGMPFPGDPHAFPTKDQVADYLDAYAWYFDLPVRTGVRVDRVQAKAGGSGFVVTAGDRRPRGGPGDPRDGRVPHPRVPAFAAGPRSPGSSSSTRASTAGRRSSGTARCWSSARPTRARRSRSTSPGAGGRHVWLAGRDTGHLPFDIEGRLGRWLDPVIWFGANHLLTRAHADRTQGGVSHLAHGQPVERARPTSWPRPASSGCSRAWTAPATAGRCSTTAPSSTSANVVWCTGFRRDYGWIEPPITDADGWPIQDRGRRRGVPGLYIVGLPFQTAIASALIGGVGRDAAFVADRVAERAAASGVRGEALAVQAGTSG